MRSAAVSCRIWMPLLTWAAALAGCGGSSPTRHPSSEAAANGDAAFIAFTRCMRAQGVHMADPYHREGHTGLTLALPPKTPATTLPKASRPCR